MLELILGIIGMLCILVAFILDEFDTRFSQDTVQYNVLNIIGSGLLAYYAWSLRGWPFLVLNVVWMVVAGIKLGKIVSR